MLAAPPTAGLLTDLDYARVRELARVHFGLVYPEGKRALVSRRVRAAAREAGYPDVASFVGAELRAPSAATLALLANHLSTNHTHFMREPRALRVYLDEALPGWIRRLDRVGQRDLRVWCAASSTGEEPYTLATLGLLALGRAAPQWKAGLLATDISTAALATAVRGTYPADQVARLPREWQVGFRPAVGGLRTVSDTLRAQVLFRRLNLLAPQYSFKGRFHAIFVRNVLIYFSPEERAHTLQRLVGLLEPGGWLFVGAAESVPDEVRGLERHSAAIYRRAA